MTSELHLMLIGVLIGATPFIFLWAISNRRAKDWRGLAERSTDNHQQTLNELIRVQSYVHILQNQMREWRLDGDDSERWKLN